MIGHDRMVHIMSSCIFDSLNVIVRQLLTIQLVSFSPARTEREICAVDVFYVLCVFRESVMGELARCVFCFIL